MKKIIALMMLAGITMSSFSIGNGVTQNIRGTVIDLDSKVTLIGVNVVIVGSNPLTGTATDLNGEFILRDLPIGRYTIEAQYLGYETKRVNNVLLQAGRELVLNIEMVESVEKVEEVVISAKQNKAEALNKMATVSARSFSVEETKRYAGSYNDPSRMAASYAGVTGSPEGNNDIVIRGNSPRGLLWRMEGVEIPNPNHFSEEGATGGPISVLNSNMLDNSDFFTGAWPAEYGNAYSGVFDIKLRNGNNKTREHSILLGMLGCDISSEGPFVSGKDASYLFNYRYSTLAMMNAVGIKIVGDAVPEFQDFSFKANLPTKKLGTFSVFGIGGISNIEEGEEDWQNDFGTDMGVLGLSNIYRLNDKNYIRTTLAATGSRNIWEYHEKLEGEDERRKIASENFIYYTYKAQTALHTKFNAKLTAKTGFIYTNQNFDLFSDYYDDDLNRMVKDVEKDGTTDMMQAYSSWRYRLTKDITINAGAHGMYYFLNDNYTVEPRAGIKWQITNRQSISAGFGMHSRVETLTSYFAEQERLDGTTFRPNKDLGLTKARHYVIGYDNLIAPNLLLKLEVYYQDLYNIPVEDNDTSYFAALNYTDGYTNMKMVNEGTGSNIGAELTVEKFFSNNYYFLVTTSVFDSKYKVNGKEYNTRFNSNYVLNVLGGKEFNFNKSGKERSLSLSLRASLAGGQYYTPIDLAASRDAGYTIRDYNNPWSEKREAFTRVDFKAKWIRNFEKVTTEVELDIQNVTNSANIAGDYYSSFTDDIETWSQMGILPVLSFRVDF